jgi:hypothetical protein
MSDDLPDIKVQSPLKISNSTRRTIETLEHNNFPICQSIYREKSEWFGLKKKAIIVHRTTEHGFDIAIIK